MRLDPGPTAPFHGPEDMTRATRDRIERLSNEVTTGRSADTGRAVRTDFSEVSRLSSDMARLDGFAHGLRRAAAWTERTQAALAGIAASATLLAEAVPLGLGQSDQVLATQAEGAIRDIAGRLNATMGGRALFAQGAPDAPLPDVDAILQDVGALAAGATTYADYANAVDSYFAPGGPFETTRLSLPGTGPVRFPATERSDVALDVSAAAPELKDVLKQALFVAGVAGAPFDVAVGSEAAADMQARLAQALGALPALQGSVGTVEARIETLAAANDAARDHAEIALADILGVDPYETAMGLQQEMARLESLFALTARRAGMRLTDYL